MAAEIHPADSGDTTTLPQTLTRAAAAVERANPQGGIQEIVADRGYHSGELLSGLAGLLTGAKSGFQMS